jgi:hypothetical protein
MKKASIVLTLGLLIFAACNKMPQETIPLPEGEVLKMEPVSAAQWEALRIEDTNWMSVFCLRKKSGVWEEYPESVAYRFSVPDEVEYYSRIHSGEHGVDGGTLTHGVYKWSFDAASSSLVINTEPLSENGWEESYTILDAGSDSFFLMRNVKKGDLLSSVSWILYKFVRVENVEI